MSAETIRTEFAIRRLSALYAQSVDRGDSNVFAELFTEDAVLDGPGRLFSGKEEIRKIPQTVKTRYIATRHELCGQVLAIDGVVATGETYCNAKHILSKEDGRATLQILSIRYQDKYRRDSGSWLIAHRRLVIDWMETRNVDLASAPAVPGDATYIHKIGD